MVYNKNAVFNNERLKREILSEDMLNQILCGTMPSSMYFGELYGSVEIKYVIPMVEKFIDEVASQELKKGRRVRELGNIYDTDIFITKNKVSNLVLFRDVDARISEWNIPEKKYFDDIHGKYSEKAAKSISEFINLRLMRKCDLPYVLHLFRSAFMALELGLDNESGLPKDYFKTLWLKHDDVEELLFNVNENGKIKYGLKKLNDFMNDYIDEEMQRDILFITNKSELILKQLKLDNKEFKNKLDLERVLFDMEREKDYSFIREDIGEMLDAIQKFEEPNEYKSLQDGLKIFLYEKVFINNLGENAYSNKYWSHMSGKGTEDLFDNFTGILSGSLEEKRKTVIKMSIWFKKVEELLQRIKTNNENYGVFEKELEKNAVEVIDHANYGAKELLVSYISRPLESVAYLRSALKSAKQFKDILYV